MADRPDAPPPLNKAQKWAAGVAGAFFAGLAGLGGYGSFTAVRDVAETYGFGNHAWIVPIGVDLGILALLMVDLILEQLDMPMPPLRWLAWAFTVATVWFNITAVSTDLPLVERTTGQGMHAAMPLLFIAFMEGARHAVRRRTGMLSERRMDGIRLSRWLLDPFGTFGIWRRMILWEVRSYRTGLILERHRRERLGDLRTRYGRRWRTKAPATAKWPLRGGMLDLALELTEAPTGTTTAPAGNQLALPAPAPGAAESALVPALALAAPAPVPIAATAVPAPAPPVPAPMGADITPAPATSEETGPPAAPTAAAHTHTPGTITVKVPAEQAPAGGRTGDHADTAGTTDTAPDAQAPTTGPHPGATPADVSASSDRDTYPAPAQGALIRPREVHTVPARPDIEEGKLAEARELARGIIRAGSGKVSRRSLKAAGLTGKTETLQEIADALNDEISAGLLVLDESA